MEAGVPGLPNTLAQRANPFPHPLTPFTHNVPETKFEGNCKVMEFELEGPITVTPAGIDQKYPDVAPEIEGIEY